MPARDHQTTAAATPEPPSTLARWWLAARPKTLPAAASGVIVGSALAWRAGSFALMPALAAFVVALLLQIASNFANDVYDDERGTDTAERLGPLRVTNAGLLTRSQVKRGMAVVLALAFAVGLYLTFVRGWLVLVLGVAAMVAAVAYTGGPYPLGYHGLGELFVLAFFGFASEVGTYWVQTGTATPLVWALALPPGLIITGILVVNNLRDIEQDRAGGKRTLAVRMGECATRVEYAACVAVPFVLVTALVIAGTLPLLSLLVWLAAPLAVLTTRAVHIQRGRALNLVLARTGQLALLLSVLLAAGLVLG